MQLGSSTLIGLGGFSRLAAPCVAFDGSNDVIIVEDNAALDVSTNLTVTVWARHNNNSFSFIRRLISKKNVSPGYEWDINMDGTRRLSVGLSSDGTSIDVWYATNEIELINKWNHYACVYDANDSLKVYVNGIILPGSFVAGSLPASINNGTAPLRIGQGTGTTSTWGGQICDARIYGSSLSATDIRNIYEGRAVGSPAAWYPLNEGSGSTATDVSGNANNGTLTSFNLTNAWEKTQDVFYYA